jgi:hypothetical protein
MRSYLLSGVLLPLLLGLLLVYATGAATLESIATIPQSEFWLLDFLGPSLINQYVRLAPYLVALQFGVCICFWKKINLLHLATVSLLALTVGTLPFGGGGKHFLWVSPLLTICVALNPDELWIFVLTFFAAALNNGIPLGAFGQIVGQPFLLAIWWAMKGAYLIKLNVRNIATEPIQYSPRKPPNVTTAGIQARIQ